MPPSLSKEGIRNEKGSGKAGANEPMNKVGKAAPGGGGQAGMSAGGQAAATGGGTRRSISHHIRFERVRAGITHQKTEKRGGRDHTLCTILEAYRRRQRGKSQVGRNDGGEESCIARVLFHAQRNDLPQNPCWPGFYPARHSRSVRNTSHARALRVLSGQTTALRYSIHIISM